jgi:lipoyl(octanoyl) transferase
LSYSVVYQDIGLKNYKEAWEYQEKIFKTLVDSKSHNDPDLGSRETGDAGYLIFVEHPHVFTLGKSGSENNLLINLVQLNEKNAQFFRTDRGGDITYHGPGQIVVYPIFDLDILKIGLKEYIYLLEEAVIRTLSLYGLTGSRLKGVTGVWMDSDTIRRARKICAIGVRASRYITMHGFAFNINTDLSYFSYINPCGFTDKGVTSLETELGSKQDFERVKLEVKNNLQEVFSLNWINQ